MYMVDNTSIDELIATYNVKIEEHYLVFEDILTQVSSKILNPREKSMIFADHATELPTTFSNEFDKMLYFNNYIKNHNTSATFAVTKRHYDLLRKNSVLLKTKTPVTKKINEYYDTMDSKYRYMNNKNLTGCLEFDYNLHLFMSFTHLLPFNVNKVFVYPELDLTHFNNCHNCLRTQQNTEESVSSQPCECPFSQQKTEESVSRCPFSMKK